MEVNDQFHASGALSLEKELPVPTGGWLGPKAGLDAVAKRKYPFHANAGNRNLVIHPVG